METEASPSEAETPSIDLADALDGEWHRWLLAGVKCFRVFACQKKYGTCMVLHIGTAGWTIPRAAAADFVTNGSHLQRYAGRMNAVEINSSFHRPHRKATYERWAAATPSEFTFCVKIPKHITHEKQLQDCEDELDKFLEEVSGLKTKLGPLLVQLPPRLAWSESVATSFFVKLRAVHGKAIVCEPRHASWFGDEPAQQLAARHWAGRGRPQRSACGCVAGRQFRDVLRSLAWLTSYLSFVIRLGGPSCTRSAPSEAGVVVARGLVHF